jgi:hypothetical protein
MSSLFDRSNQLLTGITYISFKTYPTFSHLKSIFKDGWYNQIIPSVLSNELDWRSVKEILSTEQKEGYSLSYCIPEDYLKDYQEAFAINGHKPFGSECYIHKSVSQIEDNFMGQFEEVNQGNLETFIEIAKSCFPDWTNNEEYSRLFYNLSQEDQSKVIYRNLLYKVGDQYVVICYLIISEELNLGYIHNTGVLEVHRRRGYFTDMVNYSCKLSLESGASDCYAIVENDGASFMGLSKLGFTPKHNFYLFEA